MEPLDQTRLQGLLEKHRLWVANDPNGARLELREVSLAGAVLTNAVFSRALLVDVDLSGSELRYAGFSGAELERVKFCDATLDGASFLEARLTDCTFDRARLATARDETEERNNDEAAGADFQRAELNNVSFRNSVLYGAEFTDGRLQLVTFDHSDLRRADFVACQVTNSTFVGARLSHSVLAKASFRNVALREASLQHARLRRLLGRGLIDLAGADLTGADLAQADIELLDLRNADLSDAALSKTRIGTAHVHGTRGLPFVVELSGEPQLNFAENLAAADGGSMLRLAQQLGDTSGRARFGAGVGPAHYRCRAQGEQFVIESKLPGAAAAEAIRVCRVYSTEEEGVRTLKVEYKLIDKRFCDWDELAQELIFELVIRGELRDRHRPTTDAILYRNLDGGMRMTDYG